MEYKDILKELEKLEKEVEKEIKSAKFKNWYLQDNNMYFNDLKIHIKYLLEIKNK